jgi:hypothetical protein
MNEIYNQEGDRKEVSNPYYENLMKAMDILQSPNCVRYNSVIPSPYETNINVYHDPIKNKYVVEYPGSGSRWIIIDETEAKKIIESSSLHKSYSRA